MPQKIKWKTDLEKSVVVVNFERRGWVRSDGGGGGGGDANRPDNAGSSSTLPAQTLNAAGQMSSQTTGTYVYYDLPHATYLSVYNRTVLIFSLQGSSPGLQQLIGTSTGHLCKQ